MKNVIRQYLHEHTYDKLLKMIRDNYVGMRTQTGYIERFVPASALSNPKLNKCNDLWMLVSDDPLPDDDDSNTPYDIQVCLEIESIYGIRVLWTKDDDEDFK